MLIGFRWFIKAVSVNIVRMVEMIVFSEIQTDHSTLAMRWLAESGFVSEYICVYTTHSCLIMRVQHY